MTPEQQELVEKKQRLAVGEMHQCPCARQGRLHIIKGSVDPSLQDYSKVDALWGKNYTDAAQQAHDAMEHKLEYVSSTEEYSATLHHEIFGMHSVFCGFHKSGPCTLQEVEDGVTRSWNKGGKGTSSNFSAGYVPLMDNNLMLWTESIGPLLDVRRLLPCLIPTTATPSNSIGPLLDVRCLLPLSNSILEVVGQSIWRPAVHPCFVI